MRKYRAVIWLALAATLGACSPAAVKQTAAYRPLPHYLQPAQLEIPQFPPPPAPGSETDKADLALLHQLQNRRTQAQCGAAKAQAHAYYEEFFGDISPFVSLLPAGAADFFNYIIADSDAVTVKLKDRYKRPRPFQRGAGLKSCAGMTPGLAYPSGHAAISRLFALILTDLVPERRAEFFARADEAALNRVIGGVHHPSDIEAGKRVADLIYPELLKNPAFRADLESLRKYLKP
jgi:acid phosphatase (class A)